MCEEPREGRGCLQKRARSRTGKPSFAIVVHASFVIDLSPFRPPNSRFVSSMMGLSGSKSTVFPINGPGFTPISRDDASAKPLRKAGYSGIRREIYNSFHVFTAGCARPTEKLSQKPGIGSRTACCAPARIRDTRTLTGLAIRAFPHRFKGVVCPGVPPFAGERSTDCNFNADAFEGWI